MLAWLKRLKPFWKKADDRPHRNTFERFRLTYQDFRELLDSNTEMAKVIAEIEEILHGEKYFGMAQVRSLAARAVFHSLRMIERINALSHTSYASLFPVHAKLHDRIREIIESHRRESARGTWILPYSEITASSSGEVGGKSANLGELKNRLGLPIPRGFAITVSAFYHLMETQELREEINKILVETDFESPSAVETASEAIEAKILFTPIPPELVHAILDAYDRLAEEVGHPVTLALRSSAIGEDGEVSFAGQYLSLLNVPREQLIRSYQYVVASLYTPRAMAYRFRMGISDEDCAMSVACLEMIPSRASGVCYSRHPTDPTTDAVTINAVWGLGPYAVDGVISPDTYLVTRGAEPTITTRDVAYKPVQLAINPDGGLVELPVEGDAVHKPCLTDEQILLLADYAMRVEAHYGAPQDIEWAVSPQGDLIVLQARPLHTAGTTEERERSFLTALDRYPLLLEGGVVASPGIGSGPAVIIQKDEDLLSVPKGGVLVARHSSPKFVLVMDRLQGIIADTGSVTGHMASVAREFKIPTLLDTKIATTLIVPGEEITVDAYRGKVYRGMLPEDLRQMMQTSARSRAFMEGTPVHRTLTEVARLITPLNLVDPRAPSFSPEGCRTLHDIMRFVHEKSYSEMFTLSDSLSAHEGSAHRLDAPIPLNLYLIDLGGGIAEEATARREIPPDLIHSRPFKALLRGMLHDAFLRQEPRPVEFRGFFSVLSEQMLSNPYNMERFGDRSYAIISDQYLHFSSRVGYHFALLDSYCGPIMNQNYITFSFKGGAADDVRRHRRVLAIATILTHLDFTVEVVSDRVEGRLQKYDDVTIEKILEQMGRLLQFTRQMDMLMYADSMVAVVAEAFLQENYDFDTIMHQGAPSHHPHQQQ